MPQRPGRQAQKTQRARVRASKGGYARAAALTPAERSAIARLGAQTRWQGGDAAARQRQKAMLAAEEIGDLWVAPEGTRLRLVIAQQQDATYLTEAGVQVLQQYLRRWRRWLSKQLRG